MRLRSIAAALALACAAVPAAAEPDPSPEVKLACAPDALRLCGAEIVRGIPAVAACMRKNWSSVGAACKAAVEQQRRKSNGQ